MRKVAIVPRWAWFDDIWYRLATAFWECFFRLYAPVRSYGTENVPLEGGLLLVSNHLSYLDPFVWSTTCPRRLKFMTKQECFINPFVAFFFYAYGGIPLDREHPDSTAARAALTILRQGKALGLAPEGTRSPDGNLQAFVPTFAKLATKARVPIQPAGIAGTYEVWPRSKFLPRPGRIAIVYGEPFDTSAYHGCRVDQELQIELSEMIRQRVLDLLARATSEI